MLLMHVFQDASTQSISVTLVPATDTAAESMPKRGTSVGVECSLRANEPGGTCLSFSSAPPPAILPLHPIL
jgi:hypothetical protein